MIYVSFLANYNVKEFCFSAVEFESFFQETIKICCHMIMYIGSHLPIHVPVIKGAGLQHFAMAECILYA